MRIVFYDSDCGLCQRSIRFLLAFDKQKQLFFAPLNGETYKKTYGNVPATLTSVLFYNENKTYQKSSAFLEICKVLGGWCLLLYVAKIIPVFIRDFIYDQIASRRKKITCITIHKDERFLN